MGDIERHKERKVKKLRTARRATVPGADRRTYAPTRCGSRDAWPVWVSSISRGSFRGIAEVEVPLPYAHCGPVGAMRPLRLIVMPSIVVTSLSGPRSRGQFPAIAGSGQRFLSRVKDGSLVY